MANRSWANTGKIWAPHVYPVLIDCNFVVDSTNGNGLGIRSLKGPGISAIYMHTSATPAAGNPNPASGVIIVQFQDDYNRYLGGFSGQVSAVGTPVTSATANVAYVITALGTATLAQWQAAGVPVGFTPAVGLAFIAIATGTIGGSATVAPTAVAGSGIDHIEVLGDPNTTISNSGTTIGTQIILQTFAAGAVAAAANGAVIGLAFYMSNSSVLVQGE